VSYKKFAASPSPDRSRRGFPQQLIDLEFTADRQRSCSVVTHMGERVKHRRSDRPSKVKSPETSQKKPSALPGLDGLDFTLRVKPDRRRVRTAMPPAMERRRQ